MQVTERILSKWFDEFNDKYWDGKLIKPKLLVNYDKNAWGRAHCKYQTQANKVIKVYEYIIYISNYWDTDEETKRGTMVHEMIHHYVHQYHPEEMLWPSYKNTNGHNMDGTWGEEVKRLKKFGWDITQFVKEEEIEVARRVGVSSRISDLTKNDTYILVLHKLKNGKYFMLKMTDEQLNLYLKKQFNSKTYTDEVYSTKTNLKEYQNKPFDTVRGVGYANSAIFNKLHDLYKYSVELT